MDKVVLIYGFVMLAYARFCTFIAPGVEPMFEFMLLSMFLWFVVANLRNLKKNVEPSPITRDDLLLCLGVFALIFFSTRLTEELVSTGGSLITQAVISGATVFYAGKFLKDLSILGVPIPNQVLDLIDRLSLNTQNSTETKKAGENLATKDSSVDDINKCNKKEGDDVKWKT